MKKTNLFKLSPLALLVLAACGGGGGGTDTEAPVVVVPPVVSEPPVSEDPPATVTGLSMPEVISIVTDSSASAQPQAKSVVSKVAAYANSESSQPYDDADTDYSNDRVRAYVWDESMGPLQMVNEILCYVGQTRADAFVNQTYTALVDSARCQRDNEESEDRGQSSGNVDTEYELWTIESTRESATAPQRVRIWVPAEGSDGDGGEEHPMDRQSILVDVTIASSPSDDLPFGDFSMSWKGVVDEGGNELELMAGTLQTVENPDGKLQFIFYNGSDMPGGDFSFSEAANVILDDADGTSGIGKTSTHHSDPFFTFSSEFSVAYDPTRFLRGKDENEDGTPDAQLCNDRINMDENVWRYNLYHSADGSRVNRNSGFPFTTEVGGNSYHGHVSYWGMWLPEHIDKAQVSSITRQDFSGNGSNATFDVVHSPGKLIKRSKSALLLSELDGVNLNYWDGDEYLAEYTSDTTLKDGTTVASEGFYQVARLEFSEGQREVIPMEPTLIEGDFLHFWSQSLGGSVAYDKHADPDRIIVFAEEFISGNDADLFDSAGQVALACYTDCPKAGLTASQLDGTGESPFYPNSQDASTPAVVYTFSLSDLTLRDPEGNAIAMQDGQNSSSNGQFSWGIHSGAMVLEGTQLDNPWATYNQDLSYTWETGPNDWNKMTFVRESGATDFVQFDRPMSFLYTHSNANDRNSDSSEFDGETYLLEYGGAGDLWGFPEQRDSDRHMRAFSLADGTPLVNQSGDYVVKATEMEKRMRELELASCTQGSDALSLDEALSIELPTANDVTQINFGLSDKPVVTDSPRVVGGEIVSD